MTFIRPLVSCLALALCVLPQLADAQGLRQPPRGQDEPSGPRPRGEPEKIFPTGVLWVLTEVNGKPIPAGTDATLTIDGNNRGTGSAGCNTWSSPMVAIQGQKLAMGAIAMTRRSCPAPVMAFERSYLTALHGGPSWDIVVTDLVVKAQNMTLKFKRGL